ncbi:MAG TPA: ATP-binding protein [Polyangiaceae bacterium]|nr:ATP-binding protein [Polyangiaceae bacterium]
MAPPEGLIQSLLRAPTLASDDDTRRAQLLYRLLGSMAGLAVLGTVSALFETRNDWRVTAFFYGLVGVWLVGMAVMVRRGRVVLAAWILSVLFWLLIAVVTVLFGGLHGGAAATFTVCILLLGAVVGGRAAVVMAVVSCVWCALIAWLERGGYLPPPLQPYSPVNAWGGVAVTLLMTSVLLRTSIESLEKMHARANQAARERDEALRRSIQGQKMELVGNLTSGIAHDLNNLLTVMRNVSELLRAELPAQGSDVTGLLDDLNDATSRAALMTSQLLSFGRASAQGAELLDLGTAVRDLERMLPRLLGAEITVEVDAPTGGIVKVSRAAVEQILLNLALNAKEAMPDGGRLSIRVRVDDTRVLLLTEDTGTGMDATTRERAFEPFFTTKASGTGLGLATVRDLVSHFGGSVSVESSPGQGARFEVAFPREQQALPVAASVPSEPAPQVGPAPRLLLVEDDQLVRRSTARWLGAEGFEVLAVADGEEALSVLASTTEIACVVSDIAMPRLDGEALARALAEKRPGLPLVLMSGNRSPNPALVALPTRAFVPKPLTQQELRQAITRVMKAAAAAS